VIIMPRRLVKFFRTHTGAGRYIESVEHGSAIQQDRMRERAPDPDLGEKLRYLVARNHASLRVSELFQGRG
jgi:hypothetical protein